MKKYIKQSHKKNIQERKEFTLFGNINLFVKDTLPQEVDLTNIIMDLEDTIPRKFFYDIDMVIIGQFNELISRGIRGAYMDGAIYITNEQPSGEQLFEDIVHEVAHAVEKSYEYEIYGDDSVEKEYLGKKKRFLDLLQANGIKVPNRIRYETEYSKLFDEYLFLSLGYDKVTPFSQGLFLTPYASVSVSEYFATAFEYYFVQADISRVREISPQLFNKLREISESLD